MDFIMKTLRYREGNSTKPGILDSNGVIRDISSLVKDWDSSTVTTENLQSIMSQYLSVFPLASNIDSLSLIHI